MLDLKPWKDKTVIGHLALAFGLVVVIKLLLTVLGVNEQFALGLAAGLAFGVYYGREVDQEQQKLVFNRELKHPNITLASVGFKRLLPWKWRSIRQRWDIYAAAIGVCAGVFFVLWL